MSVRTNWVDNHAMSLSAVAEKLYRAAAKMKKRQAKKLRLLEE
jgi:hypothetical protein